MFVPFGYLDIKSNNEYFSDIMQFDQHSKQKNFYRASPRQRLIAAVVFLLITGLFILLRLAAEEKVDIELLTDPCGFKQRYGLPCPTCGIP